MDYAYKLIFFVATKDIDVVPSSWLTYDEIDDKLYAKFMPGPYPAAKAEKLAQMVHSLSLPTESWPLYEIEIRGRAKTMEEASTKLSLLGKKPFVFSTDDEQSAKAKSADEKKAYRLKTITKDPKSIESQLKLAACNIKLSPSEGNKSISRKFNKNSKAAPKKSRILDSSGADSEPEHSECASETTEGDKSNVYEDSPTPGQSNNAMIEKKRSNERNDNNVNAEDGYNSIHTQISEYFAKNKHRKNDPSVLLLGGILHLQRQMSQLRAEIVSVNIKISSIHQELESNIHSGPLGQKTTSESDDELNFKSSDLILPFTSMDAFKEFDEALCKQQECQRQTKQKWGHLLNKESGVTRTVGLILRAFLSQDVAINFTTKKQMPGKEIFKNTVFYKKLEAFIIKAWKEGDVSTVSPHTFENSVKSILNNSKDWNGKRAERLKK